VNVYQVYWRIQYRRTNRYWREVGVAPWVGYLVSGGLFLSISAELFSRTGFAPYLYASLAVFTLSLFNDRQRTSFLRQLFLQKSYYQLRLVENTLVSIPFLSVLMFYGDHLVAFVLLALTLLLARIPDIWKSDWVMPTPFGKKPFEFARGFRASWPLFLLIFLLLLQGVVIGNEELALFSVGCVFLVAMGYYQPPEPVFWVWLFRMRPAAFLQHKLRTGLVQASVLAALPALLVLFAFPGYWQWLVLVFLAGYLFLALLILGKYAAYPAPISMPQAILFALCIWFPPALLVMLPFFYRKALRAVAPILV